jgi:hypothetical protein
MECSTSRELTAPPASTPPMSDSMEVLLAIALRSPTYDFCNHHEVHVSRSRAVVTLYLEQ